MFTNSPILLYCLSLAVISLAGLVAGLLPPDRDLSFQSNFSNNNNQNNNNNHNHRHSFSRQIEAEENRNRKHVWDWLDRIHNERKNKSITTGNSSTSSGLNRAMILSFVTPPPGPPASDLLGNISINKQKKTDLIIGQEPKRRRDAIGDSSIEVDYADSGDQTGGMANSNNNKNADQDYLDEQLKSAIESKKLTASTTTTRAPVASRTRSIAGPSTSLSAVLKFSSTRTNVPKSTPITTLVFNPTKVQQQPKQEQQPKRKRTSSVLNLPPVKQDWTFACPPGKSGYFADTANDCRVYYVCSAERGERQRFVCPTGTRFNQAAANCDWWDKVNCDEDESDLS